MRSVFVIIGLLSVVTGFAQRVADTSYTINPVTVTAHRFQAFNTGSKVMTPDSIVANAFAHQQLADLLLFQSQMHIRSYNPSLATTSFRGTSSEHTAVLWKGFNIQSPLLGSSDLSLIPNESFETATIQYGGNGALFGSGAIGGSIQLQSMAKYTSGLHATLGSQIGSFGHLRNHASVSYGNAKWYTQTKLFRLNAKNNFPYQNNFVAGNPEVKMQNAEVYQQAFINEHYVQLNSNQELNIAFWIQSADREIAPTMSVANVNAFQKDEQIRATAEWKYNLRKSVIMARTAYFNEKVNFKDPSNIELSGFNQSHSSITEVELRKNWNTKHIMNIGLNNTLVRAYSTGFSGWFMQNRTALFASYKMNKVLPKTFVTFNLREELVQGNLTPIMPSMGVEYELAKWMIVMANMNRSYRLPTFNELYWRSVSQRVVPESGWGQELTVKLHKQLSLISTTLLLTGFNRNIQNWIVWQPAGIDWAPKNLKQVWSRGAEGVLNVSYHSTNFKLQYQGMFNLVFSTNTETSLANDAALNKQLIYVPRTTQQHHMLAIYKKWNAGVLYQYTGLRFTSTDNSVWLNDYVLLTLIAGKTITIHRMSFTLSTQINNILDKQYQVMADRPMPGRNYLINLQFKI